MKQVGPNYWFIATLCVLVNITTGTGVLRSADYITHSKVRIFDVIVSQAPHEDERSLNSNVSIAIFKLQFKVPVVAQIWPQNTVESIRQQDAVNEKLISSNTGNPEVENEDDYNFEESKILDDDFFPEEVSASSLGLTRLVCPGGISFHATQPTITNLNHLVKKGVGVKDGLWLSLDQPHPHPAVSLLRSILDLDTQSSSAPPFSSFSSSSMTFGLILEDGLYPNHPNALNFVNASEIDQCEIDFIPINQQILKPTRAFVPSISSSSSSSELAPLIGQIPVRADEHDTYPDAMLIHPSPAMRSSSSPSSSSSSSSASASAFLHSGIFTFDVRDGNPFVTHPCEPSTSGSYMGRSKDSNIMFVSESAMLKAGSDPFGVEGALEPIVEPVAEPMGGVLNTGIGGKPARALGQMLEAGLNDIIPPDLGGKLEKELPPQITDSLTDSVVQELPQEITAKLRQQLTGLIVAGVEKDLLWPLEIELESIVPTLVTPVVTNKVIVDVSRNVGQILGMGLTHTLVPSLVHTLTHSPLSDYYCYYCYYHDEYCSYCQSSPAQSYFAMYYAGYFSTYYAAYYAKFFTRDFLQDISDASKWAQPLKDDWAQLVFVAPPEDGKGDPKVLDPSQDDKMPIGPAGHGR